MDQVKIEYDAVNRVCFLRGSGFTWNLRAALRQIGGAWDSTLDRWAFPADGAFLRELATFLRPLGVDLDLEAYTENLVTGDNRSFVPKLPAHGQVPFPHQGVGVAFLLENQGALLLDEMGLGKTKQAIDAAYSLFASGAATRACIVCPNSVKIPWKEEIEKQIGQSDLVIVPAGSTKDREKVLLEKTPGSWVIVNYEALRYMEKAFRGFVQGQILICDEAHRLKNGRAIQTQIVTAARPAFVWGLTGTPVANRLEDVWSLVNIVRPGLLGWRWFQFERRHVTRNKFGAISGYKHVDEIKAKLARVSLRRTKAECLELPDKLFEKRVVTLSHQEQKAYASMKEHLVAWLGEQDQSRPLTVTRASTFGAQFVRLRQITDGFISAGVDAPTDWSKETTKISEAVRTWEDSGRRRCVIWCQWVPVARKAIEAFKAEAAHVAGIWGEVPIKDRAAVVEAWGKTEGSVLVCQMDTAGVGLNLQAADLEIFVDCPVTPMQRNQCVDRLHRIGQRNAVTIVDIIAANTVDDKLLKRLAAKIDMAESVYEEIPRDMKSLLDLVG